jgi:hypothetical protein
MPDPLVRGTVPIRIRSKMPRIRNTDKMCIQNGYLYSQKRRNVGRFSLPNRFLVEDESSEVSYRDKTSPWTGFIDGLLEEIEATESDL